MQSTLLSDLEYYGILFQISGIVMTTAGEDVDKHMIITIGEHM